ncbi:MAG: Z1 domain-containing protein [Sulfurimonas sp.]
MNRNYQEILNAVKLKLQNEVNPTQNEIKKAVQKSKIFLEYELSSLEEEKMLKEIESLFQITIQAGTQIVKTGWQPWLHLRTEEQKKEFYTQRYKNYLFRNTDMPNSVVNEIFSSTDKILECMANPLQTDGFKKKGLVVGHVQSGKTANYIALINKAADVGYKLIILIAGVHKNLRTQTQKRVNEGFIGFDSLKREFVGIGLGADGKINIPVSFTSTENDFKNSNLKSLTFDPTNSKVPVVLVIKKNSSTLKNIISWLETSKDKDTFIRNYPMLLIDDEADNASINTKKKPNEATTINKQIRQILNMFYKVSYVGFTATPFANIFIDPDAEHEEYKDDLFPDDFIISLETPSNYFGAKKVFLEESEKYLKTITDNEICFPVPQSKDFKIDGMPESFFEAMYLFILAIGIKKIRGIKNPHTSMLVNVTHKNDYQIEVKNIIYEELSSLLGAIKWNYKKPFLDAIKNEKIAKLYKLWQNEYKSTNDFIQILSEVVKLESQIKTLLINSKSKEQLNYDDYKDDGGLHVIAVGGYSLSRGFTLEGLTVSYFLRNTAMYDTLLQMGRWFGYRDGYDDICRVYLTEKSLNWYAHIASVLEDLREEFKVLEYHKLTPRDYGLKVQTHPEKLLITALNKMYNSDSFVLSTSYSSSLFEVKALDINKQIITKNQKALEDFLAKLEKPLLVEQKGYLWSDVDILHIINFINKFTVYESEKKEIDTLLDYIEGGKDLELVKWDVYLPSTGTSDRPEILNDFDIKMQKRTVRSVFDGYVSFKDGGGRIVRFFDEEVGLTENQVLKAQEIRKIKNIKQSGEPYRQVRNKPLLVVKVLEIATQSSIIAREAIAFGISFPKSFNNRSVEFKVNKVWIKQNLGVENEDEERDDD